MESEKPIIFKSTDIIWLFSVDLLNRIDNMENVIEKISNCEFCDAILRYHTSEEPGKSGITIKRDIEESQGKKYEELLELICNADFDILDIEYIEKHNFSRFLLKEVEIKFSFSAEYSKCNVLLTISKLGVAIFTIWTNIEENLDSSQIAKLQLLPTENLISTKIKIPLEILKEASIINRDFVKSYEEAISEKKNYYLLEDDAIEVLIHILWFSLINVLQERKHKSKTFEEFHSFIEKDLRYEVICNFPIVIINSTEPTYKNAYEILNNHPRQLYQILSHVYNFDYKMINPGALDNFFKQDLSERLDVAYFDALGSVLLIMSEDTVSSSERLSLSLEVLILIEILQIQRHYIGFITEFLTQPISKMHPREISITQSYLSDALDIYHSNITRDALARKRLERGKDVMEIDEQFEMVKEKIELLGEALNRFSNLRSNFFQIVFAIIIGLIPIYSIFSTFLNPILTLIFTICIITLILTIFYFLSINRFKHLEQKKIK